MTPSICCSASRSASVWPPRQVFECSFRCSLLAWLRARAGCRSPNLSLGSRARPRWLRRSAAVLEILAFYIPGLDHLLDVLAAPLAVIAGVLASASVMVDMPAEVRWPIAVIAGGGVAALTKGATALVRAKSAALTGGLGNPVVSTAETAGAATVSIPQIVRRCSASPAWSRLLFGQSAGCVDLGLRRHARPFD